MDTTSSKAIPKPLTNYDRAAIATEAVELRIERVREAIGYFTAAAINEHGFYTDPLALTRKLASAETAIKDALAILVNNCWPGEDEDEAPPPVSTHITKSRQRCAAELRMIKSDMRESEEEINSADDSRRLAATMRRLIQIGDDLEAITAILYNSTFPPPRFNPQ